MSEKESVHIMQDKWSIRDVAEALAKHGLIEKQTEQELRDCKTCIHSNKENCAGTEECHECMWDSKYEQQSCDDAISRQAVLDLIYADWKYEGLETHIESLPPVNPTKTGHWVFVDKAHEHAHCSECDYGNVDLLDGRPHNYCPNCGCRMVEPQESEE